MNLCIVCTCSIFAFPIFPFKFGYVCLFMCYTISKLYCTFKWQCKWDKTLLVSIMSQQSCAIVHWWWSYRREYQSDPKKNLCWKCVWPHNKDQKVHVGKQRVITIRNNTITMHKWALVSYPYIWYFGRFVIMHRYREWQKKIASIRIQRNILIHTHKHMKNKT